MKKDNFVSLTGYVGRDAELRTTTTGKELLTWSVATSESYKDKDGNWQSKTAWHNCKKWNPSDWDKKTLNKGALVTVFGKIEYGEYEKDGQKHKTTDILVDEIWVSVREKKQTAETKTEEDGNDLPF